jgi:hypothetical protein
MSEIEIVGDGTSLLSSPRPENFSTKIVVLPTYDIR